MLLSQGVAPVLAHKLRVILRVPDTIVFGPPLNGYHTELIPTRTEDFHAEVVRRI